MDSSLLQTIASLADVGERLVRREREGSGVFAGDGEALALAQTALLNLMAVEEKTRAKVSE